MLDVKLRNKKKFETMQTVGETLFANRNTIKEKNARSNYPRSLNPFNSHLWGDKS
jgi:hypothetical protein